MNHVRTKLVLAIVSGMMVAGSSLGQPGRGPGGPGGPFGGGGPPVTSAQLERYAKILGLSPDQKEAAKALVEGAEKQSNVASEKVREEFRRAREAGDDGQGGSPEAMRERMDKMRQQREDLEKTTLADLKSLLTPEQEKLWPGVERLRRREAVGRQGMISGERVDLLEIAERQEWTADLKAKAKPVLDNYEMDLDRALVQREELFRNGMGEIREKMRAGDEAGAQAIMDRGRQASQRVRDVNRKYARELEDMLPEEGKASLKHAVLRASYPRVYNQRLAERQLDAATKLDGLDTTQVEQIKELNEKSGREFKSLREKMVTATEEMENNFRVGDFRQRFRGGGGGGDEDGPLADLGRERRELERGIESKLKSILKAEQLKQLPSDDDDDDRGEGRGDRRRQRNERT